MQDVSYHNGATPTAWAPRGPRFANVPAFAIRDHNLTYCDKCVLMVITLHANAISRECELTHDEIGEILGANRQTVNEATRKLSKHGYILIMAQWVKGTRGRGPNRYRVLFDTKGGRTPPDGGQPLAPESIEDDGTITGAQIHQKHDTATISVAAAHQKPVFTSSNGTANTDGYSRQTAPETLLSSNGNSIYKEDSSSDLSSLGSDLPDPEQKKREEQNAHARAESSPPEEDVQVDVWQHERPDLWRAVYTAIHAQQQASDQQRDSWLKPCQLFELDGDFVLAAPRSMVYQMMRGKWEGLARDTLKKIAHERHIPFQGFELIRGYDAQPAKRTYPWEVAQ